MKHTEITSKKLEYFTSQLAAKIKDKYYNKTEIDEKLDVVDVDSIEYEDWIKLTEEEREALGLVEILHYPIELID